MDNADKILEKIREENVKPKPRWQFTFRNALAWSGFAFAVLFGALAFSVILYAIQQLDFNVLEQMSRSFPALLLTLVPVFWIISLVIFLVFAMFSIGQSRKGYKFTLSALAGYTTALSILFGTLFFISGGADWLEHVFASEVSIYESVDDRKVRVWSMPEEGYLSGTITSVGDDSFGLKDFNGNTWQVGYGDAEIVPAVQMTKGEKIKIIGKMTSHDRFEALNIRPWGGGNRYRHGNFH